MDHLLSQPAFYMPFTARTNPYLDQGRIHVKQWAQQMGLLDDAYTAWPDRWSQQKFDEADFCLWTAMTHPDVGLDELNLVTDWHVTLWFVDDLFLPLFQQNNDRQAARCQIHRLLDFLPIDGLPRPYLVPENPVERAFADLWPKTAPPMTPDWRRRFVCDIERFLHGVLWELDHLEQDGQDGVADPIEYIYARREFGGLPMTSTLMEHGLGEIPEKVYRMRPFQSALRAFADIVSLHNDIVSYDREVAEGSISNNGVEVLRKALDCGLEHACGLLNQLLTARVRTLENTVGPDLTRAMEEEDLPEPLPRRVTKYVQALKDATAGSYAWHTATGRFDRRPAVPHGPTGIGTSAARLPHHRAAGRV
jgi:germacradienol/geosmin synthase